ncbi:hypothetical protein ACIGXI_22815 [Kitasatospora aureofaciens]|uniref:hypothetical protein n=1 Tax=Kitasatospora aureofaciens TaxID=1894 RepID=UPI0037C8642C
MARATGALVTVLPVLVLWGFSYGGVSVATQDWVRLAAPAEPTAACWACVFNALHHARVAGRWSLVGGLVVDRAGTDAVLLTAAGTVTAGLLPTALSRRGAGAGTSIRAVYEACWTTAEWAGEASPPSGAPVPPTS